jgi:hypothetical protein
MIDSRDARNGTLWALAAFACFVVMTVGFFHCAPWLVAMSAAEAELQWPGRIDPSWPAVVNDHGRPAPWIHGTIASNPFGFAGWLLVLLAGTCGWWYCFAKAREAIGRSH